MQIVNEILDPRVPFFSWGFAFSIGRQNWKGIYRKMNWKICQKMGVVKERYKESREDETTRD